MRLLPAVLLSLVLSCGQPIPGPAGAKGETGATGTPGSNAELGPDTPVQTIAACGENSSPFKEVLLCLYDGKILASFSDSASGKNTRFAYIGVGFYDDTDSSGCQFSVSKSTADFDSYVVSWNAGHNQYATWEAGSYTCQYHPAN